MVGGEWDWMCLGLDGKMELVSDSVGLLML
jgi:hypothetical protein